MPFTLERREWHTAAPLVADRTWGRRPGACIPAARGHTSATPLSRTRIALPGWHWPACTCAVYCASLTCSAAKRVPAGCCQAHAAVGCAGVVARQGLSALDTAHDEHAGIEHGACRRLASGSRADRSAERVGMVRKACRWGCDSRPAREAPALLSKDPTSRTRALLALEKACEARVAERIYEESEASSVRSGPKARCRVAAAQWYLVAQV
jgi:hypothetical protein